MNSTLAYLRGRRAWLVENYNVYGSDAELEIYSAICESINATEQIGFKRLGLGGWRQEVYFSDLTDNKGNSLPDQIKQPAVVVMPRSSAGAHIKYVLGQAGFVIARSSDESATTTVDLLIFETGL